MNNKIVNKFGIHLKVRDIYKSYSFYSVFNLPSVFCYGDLDWIKTIQKTNPSIGNALEKYNGVTFDIQGALFEIADGHVAVKPEVFKENIPNSKVSAMLDVESVDNIVKICHENNFDIVVEPRVFPWGTKEVVIKDPDGFILVFREFVKK
ncbi:MAG TPA: VOC family protein [Candidatus Dojkabacteria bacterium]|nr:VOC family protein [Candidatus Dojkabacteria bacterium]